MVVRDVDLLAELSRSTASNVCFSITTLDDALGRRLEPGTAPSRKRLRAMERLVLAGVNAGVLLAPIVPGITDSPTNLKEVVHAAADHGARFLGSNVLYLKDGTKNHFVRFLEQEYPSLTMAYRTLYPGAFAPWKLKRDLQDRVAELKRAYGLQERWRESVSPTSPRQMELGL